MEVLCHYCDVIFLFYQLSNQFTSCGAVLILLSVKMSTSHYLKTAL